MSDLQLLIQTAHDAFTSYNVMAFCLKAEAFVDDKLSNWYVRRNRRRFWKSEQGADKLAAYQTLYTVLTTLTRLFAPVSPEEPMIIGTPSRREASSMCSRSWVCQASGLVDVSVPRGTGPTSSLPESAAM